MRIDWSPRIAMAELTLNDLNRLEEPLFVSQLGAVFEHSPWVARAASTARPFASLEELHRAMVEVVRLAPPDSQLKLIRAHPDLAGRAALAGELTDHSAREQAGAGLNSLSPEEYARFHSLNGRYLRKFDFPFVLAIKGHTKHSILASFEERLKNDVEAERARALDEIAKIARFRLEELLGG